MKKSRKRQWTELVSGVREAEFAADEASRRADNMDVRGWNNHDCYSDACHAAQIARDEATQAWISLDDWVREHGGS